MPTEFVVIIQAVKVAWTKAARSGENAVKRNRVPEVFSIPAALPKPTKTIYLLQAVSFAEQNDFKYPLRNEIIELEKRTPSGILDYDKIQVRQTNDQLKVNYDYSRIKGAPERRPYNHQFALELNQWGRVRHNGRWSWNKDWTYSKWVFNIGWFSALSANVFLEIEPTHTFSNMADLW